MAEAPASPAPLSPLEVELDPEFEPQSRPRSCTWPLQRPELQASPAKPSGETAADSMIPEEEDDEDDEDGGGRAGSAMAIGGGGSGTLGSGLLVEDSARVLAPGGQDPGSGPATAAGALSGGTQALLQPQQPLPPPQPGAAGGSGQPRKCSSRRNAWGNLSYADLITRAIESSPDKRLTLSQIYEWMVRCVPYFKDKGDSNSSAGWKYSNSAKKLLANGKFDVQHGLELAFNSLQIILSLLWRCKATVPWLLWTGSVWEKMWFSKLHLD
ncbi:hypothetical protein H8958_013239 [Nasalis larvatus]